MGVLFECRSSDQNHTAVIPKKCFAAKSRRWPEIGPKMTHCIPPLARFFRLYIYRIDRGRKAHGHRGHDGQAAVERKEKRHGSAKKREGLLVRGPPAGTT